MINEELLDHLSQNQCKAGTWPQKNPVDVDGSPDHVTLRFSLGLGCGDIPCYPQRGTVLWLSWAKSYLTTLGMF